MDFLEFVKEWWCFISLGLLILVEIMRIFIRKPSKVLDTLKEEILTILPAFIAGIETTVGEGCGQKKKELVIKAINDWFKIHHPEIDALTYTKFVSESIESILTTPQKKV